MERTINEEKREKFIEFAGKRVNNVLHDIQILEPMARSNNYDFTRADVEDMFNAMQSALNDAKEEYNRKFEEKARAEKKTFSFSSNAITTEPVSVAIDDSTTIATTFENTSTIDTTTAVAASTDASSVINTTTSAEPDYLATSTNETTTSEF